MTLDNVVDLAVDSTFDVYLNHKGELATVSGRAAFEQRLVIELTERLQPIIGDFSDENAIGEAKKLTARIAAEEDNLDNVATFDAYFSEDKPDTMIITLLYDTGEELTFEVEG